MECILDTGYLWYVGKRMKESCFNYICKFYFFKKNVKQYGIMLRFAVGYIDVIFYILSVYLKYWLDIQNSQNIISQKNLNQ